MRRYRYVGPETIRAEQANAPGGTPISAAAELAEFLVQHPEDGGWMTYVIDEGGALLVAPRRSEHVACASGQAVLAAGELHGSGGEIDQASNLSTGYCPEPECWSALAAALDRAGIARPDAFTFAAEFRRCSQCGERNLLKDGYPDCAVCGATLPAEWNFTD
jgi:hypothetical protein